MTQEFVPYELAVKLKALGFDEPCIAIFGRNNELSVDDGFYKQENYHKDTVLAPTYSAAFRWFREKYGLYSWVKLHNGYINDSFYKKLPITWTIMESESGKQYYERDIDHNYLYHKQEEAELACLTKLIEIVESKSE